MKELGWFVILDQDGIAKAEHFSAWSEFYHYFHSLHMNRDGRVFRHVANPARTKTVLARFDKWSDAARLVNLINACTFDVTP